MNCNTCQTNMRPIADELLWCPQCGSLCFGYAKGGLEWCHPNSKTAQLGYAINEAAEDLPPGWTIHIEVEFEGGSIELHDCEGNTHEYPCNHESWADEIRDATEYASGWKEQE